MYLSCDNGQTFHSIRSDTCLKCHDRVIACPHINYHDRCIKLPEKTSHIKIVQPTVKIRDTRAVKDLKMITEKLEVPENVEVLIP